MQLILETEPTVDIKKNMTTLEETIENKLINCRTEDNPRVICDGNKENIDKTDNVILDSLDKATSDLIEDINAGNIFSENATVDVLPNTEDVDRNSVQSFVTALINDLENEDHIFSMAGNDTLLNESHSNDNDVSVIKEDKDLNDESSSEEPAKSEIYNECNTIHACSTNKEIHNVETSPLTEENNRIKSADSRENVSWVKEEHIILEDDANLSNEITSTQDESNTIALDVARKPEPLISGDIMTTASDAKDDVVDTTTAEDDNINCIDDDEVTICDDDKEVSTKDSTVSNLTQDKDLKKNEDMTCVNIVDDDKETLQISEKVKFVDDLTSDVDRPAKKLKRSVSEEDKSNNGNAMDCDDVTEVHSTDSDQNVTVDLNEDPILDDVEEIKEIINVDTTSAAKTTPQVEKTSVPPSETQIASKNIETQEKMPTRILKLSNTLDILSDDDDEEPVKSTEESKTPEPKEKCINIEDDDDIMVIDDVAAKNDKTESCPEVKSTADSTNNSEVQVDVINNDGGKETVQEEQIESNNEPLPAIPTVGTDVGSNFEINEKQNLEEEKLRIEKPLLPEKFLQSAKKNLADMTRDDLEEFCILKIVEAVVDRSSLNEIKSKLKTMTQSLDDYRKKSLALAKQNRDLQVVFKSVQEELKKNTDMPITPFKITRSVGMQVFMNDQSGAKKKSMPGPNPTQNSASKQTKTPNQRPQKTVNNNQTIPVPRLVPAVPANISMKGNVNSNQIANQAKVSSSLNGMKVAHSSQKAAEKRTHSRSQSVTVDLTDDEPPPKVVTRNAATPPVRLVPSQNLLASARQQFHPGSSPRKVYIPITSQQSQSIRPGQTIMLKPVGPQSVARQRGPPPHIVRAPNHPRPHKFGARHPAPLPEPMKQYQPPNWKLLPPAPELKLSKVENGIVISWKIDGFQDDVYEEIASFQLFAYQETSAPPNTALWKKIGDVKALPLPMACTLTQFMAGFKYYFAVRAIDIRSRIGPFSFPGSILLLNKM